MGKQIIMEHYDWNTYKLFVFVCKYFLIIIKINEIINRRPIINIVLSTNVDRRISLT